MKKLATHQHAPYNKPQNVHVSIYDKKSHIGSLFTPQMPNQPLASKTFATSHINKFPFKKFNNANDMSI